MNVGVFKLQNAYHMECTTVTCFQSSGFECVHGAVYNDGEDSGSVLCGDGGQERPFWGADSPARHSRLERSGAWDKIECVEAQSHERVAVSFRKEKGPAWLEQGPGGGKVEV